MEMCDNMCIICQDAPRAVRYFECGHSHTCVLCTLKLISRSGQSLVCPTCKEAVVRIDGWDPLETPQQPEFIKGATGGTSVESFIEAHAEGDAEHVEAYTAAKKAWTKPAVPCALRRWPRARQRLRHCWRTPRGG